MLIRLFRTNRPGGVFLLPVLLALLWPGVAPRTLGPAEVPGGMPLAHLVAGWVQGPWAEGLVSGALVLCLCILLVDLADRTNYFGHRNYLPALWLPVLLALWPGGLKLTPALMGMPFVLLAMRNVLAVPVRSSARMALFDAGLLVGVATLFHLPFGFMVVPLWASLSVMRPFQWRDHLMPALGFAAMLFLAWGVLHLWPVLEWKPFPSMLAAPPQDWERHWMHDLVLRSWCVLAAVVFLAYSYGDYSRAVMQGKNIRAAIFALGLSLAVMAALEVVMLGNRVPAVMLATPLALFAARSVAGERGNGWGEAVFWGLLLLALWGRWVG